MNTPSTVTRHSLEFLRPVLPPAPARLLEVGCGAGALALALEDAGWNVTAIDSSAEAVAEARAAGMPALHADLIEYQDKPFDAVLFTRSLHHIGDLDLALVRALNLLAPQGLLIVEEMDLAAVDEPTAAWILDLIDVLAAAGLATRVEDLGHHHEGPPPDPHAPPLARWRAHHQRHGVIHDGRAMKEGIEARFELLEAQTCPYLFRYVHRLAGDAPPAVVERVLALETDRIRGRLLRPVGLRLVGRRAR